LFHADEKKEENNGEDGRVDGAQNVEEESRQEEAACKTEITGNPSHKSGAMAKLA
jgi:hypothetical protein